MTSPRKNTARDIAAHQKRLAELADRIKAFATMRNTSPVNVRRSEYEEGDRAWLLETTSTFFARSYWGAAKEIATGGAVEAPPLDAIPAGHKVKGVSSLIGADGALKAQWVKTAEVRESSEEMIARLFEELPRRVPVKRGKVEAPASAGSADLLACYILGDPHLGLLAWKPESGASFDLQIAERLMCSAVRDLVLRGPRTKKAMLVSLGDLFHADNSANHTTRGDHTLDVDGRMSKVLSVGMTIITTMIDALLEHHEEVEVDCIQGNHDQYTSLVFSIALSSYYRNEPRIKIPVNPASRHYHQFGNNLIGCVHGDRNKLETLGEIMATEEPKAWGSTEHRVWFVGHVHHSQVKELRGCTVETFRTLAARDSWHAGQGYSSQRDIRRVVYHAQYGEVSREVAGLQYLESLV